MNQIIKRQYGTFDILPQDVLLWQYIENKMRFVAEKYGFEEIRFPTFEATGLFCRGVGDTTDIVQKEMYTFDDREKRSLSLRPEGTSCVVRSIIENGLVYGAMPLKLYYIGNFFRHEKPQKGRSREFFQFGTELFGSDSPAADATVILLAQTLFNTLKIKNISLHINSIGCDKCRNDYNEALRSFFESCADKLCPTCRERLKTNPRRILDCKDECCHELCANAPRTVDYLCDECSTHFNTLQKLLTDAGVDFTVDVKIVRGLDYYTRTVFEFIDTSIGAQSTVCGGGRYNKLVSMLGGPETPAVGFGMGITRLIESMRQSEVVPDLTVRPDIYIAPLGSDASLFAATLTECLRSKGLYAETDICSRSVKAQMKYADKIKAHFTAVIGDNELSSGKINIKNMDSGECVECAPEAAAIIKIIAG